MNNTTANPHGLTSRQIITSLVDELAIIQAAATVSDNSNPLATAAEEERNILLTLYALFPKELPFALDLLDRRLLYRFSLADGQHSGHEEKDQQARDQSEDSRLDSAHLDRLTSTHATVNKAETQHSKSTIDLDAAQNAESEAKSTKTGRTYADQRQTSSHTQEVSGTKMNGLYYVKSAQHHARSRYRDDNPAHYEVRLRAWSCSCPAFSISAFPPIQGARRQQPGTQKSRNINGNGTFGGLALEDEPPVCKHLLACHLAEHCSQFRSFVEERAVSVAEMAAWAAGWGD